MNITNLLGQINNAFSSVNQNADMSAVTPTNIKDIIFNNGMDTLLNLISGSKITGQINQVDGNNVIIDLGNNSMINATLNGNIVPKEGDYMSFLVNNNSDGKINLSPLYVNTAPNSNISEALNQASLPDNPQTQYMVKSMMEEGLSVDRNSLLEMSRFVSEYKDVDPKSLAVMKRMDIPITDSNVEQFVKYENLEHAISNTINDVGDALFSSIDSILYNTSEGEMNVGDTIRNLVEILLPEDEVSETAQNVVTDKDNDNELSQVKNFIEIEKGESDKNINITENIDNKADSDKINVINKENSNQNISKTIKNIIDEVINKDLSKENSISKDVDVKELKELFNKDSFKDLFKQAISEKWFLKPEDVANENSVSKLYEKLNTHMKMLSEALEKSGNSETPLAQNVNNVSNNIDFMNELNQTFNYVQIPLKLANKATAGELYVYTNKKSLAQKDGNVSALLHLDMDNLGPLDVHVSMNENKFVQTKFYLKDDEALQLIASNIDILNERLNKRGYSMNAEFINKNDNKTIFDNMKETDRINIISQTSFDARA